MALPARRYWSRACVSTPFCSALDAARTNMGSLAVEASCVTGPGAGAVVSGSPSTSEGRGVVIELSASVTIVKSFSWNLLAMPGEHTAVPSDAAFGGAQCGAGW